MSTCEARREQWPPKCTLHSWPPCGKTQSMSRPIVRRAAREPVMGIEAALIEPRLAALGINALKSGCPQPWSWIVSIVCINNVTAAVLTGGCSPVIIDCNVSFSIVQEVGGGDDFATTVLRDPWDMSRSAGVWERLSMPDLQFAPGDTMRFTVSPDSYSGCCIGATKVTTILARSEGTLLPICSSQAGFGCGGTRLVCRQAVTTSWPRSPLDTTQPVGTAGCLSF